VLNCRYRASIFASCLAIAGAASADEGMWTFDNFPSSPLEQR
jgi:hypothetical protein